MASKEERRLLLPSRQIIRAFIGLFGISTCLYGLLYAIDFWDVATGGPLGLILSRGAIETLNSLGEVTVGILGIALTVIAIIVELSAQRYTPRVTELFVRDPVNISVLAFFSVTAILVFWINMSLFGPVHPKAMVLVAWLFMSLCLIALLPYFAYVFDFLSPTKVVARIRINTSDGIAAGIDSPSTKAFDNAREVVVSGIEQLGEMALNSIDKKDKAIAISSLEALASVAEDALRYKADLPEEWFKTDFLTRGDPDFVALHKVMVQSLEDRKTWIEMKIFRQYQSAFNASVKLTADINHLIAIHTRRIATYASAVGDLQTMTMAMRFMNTYLRATINAGDVRGAYNTLNEYRMLGEALLVRGYDPLLVEVAGYLKFYGQLAFSMNKAFILESAAYDICALLEMAHKNKSECHDTLLTIFLDVDREPEGERSQERALRGVRKAQVKLATYYLVCGERELARRIYTDMKDELTSRLQSIQMELMSIEEPEYWEVSDRGINFDYLAPDRRATLAEFFGWFAQATGVGIPMMLPDQGWDEVTPGSAARMDKLAAAMADIERAEKTPKK